MVNGRYSAYKTKLAGLADGSLSPREVSEWAVKEQLNIEAEGNSLTKEEDGILSSLQLAGALNEKGEYLYQEEDFREWLKDL